MWYKKKENRLQAIQYNSYLDIPALIDLLKQAACGSEIEMTAYDDGSVWVVLKYDSDLLPVEPGGYVVLVSETRPLEAWTAQAFEAEYEELEPCTSSHFHVDGHLSPDELDKATQSIVSEYRNQFRTKW